MGGFSNITGDQFGTVVNSDNASFDGTARGGVLSTDGELWIGSAANPRVKVGTLTSPLGTVSIGYSSPDITLDITGGATAIEEVNVQTGTSPIVPSAGAITFNGAVVAAGSNPVRTDGTSADTMALEVQISQAIPASDATTIGLASFSSAQFGVDANGFVTLVGGGGAPTLGLTPDAHTAPGTSPVVPNGSGNIALTGSLVAAGTTPIQTNSLAANTVAVQVQTAQSSAATSTNKQGLASFDSASFSVDSNGFVSLLGGGLAIDSIHPDSGTDPVVPTSTGLVNIVGSGSTTTVGSLNTLTMQLTGLTNHAVLVGAGTSTITKVAATATTGQVFQNNNSADPSWSTATYPSTTTINQLLYSSAANTVSGLSTANNGVLTTGTSGTPVITALATDGQLIIGSSGGAPAAATLTAGTGISITNANNSITIASTGAPSPTGTVTLYEDFLGVANTVVTNYPQLYANETWVAGSGFTTDGTNTTNGHPGVITHGAFSSGGKYFQLAGTGTASSNSPFILGGGALTLTWIIRINTASNSTNRYILTPGLCNVNLFGASTPGNDSIYFSYSDNVNSGNWIYVSNSGGSVTTSNSSVAASTGWHNLTMTINAAGTSIAFSVDGVSLGTPITTNITSLALGPFFLIAKGLGTIAAGSVSMDMVYISQTLTTSR